VERVAFIIEDTGERIGALLNPETLVARRTAGVRRRRSLAGPVTGVGLSDDPLLYTGGGTTELLLDLLFDVTLAGSTIETDNVRELTGPFWELAENAIGQSGYGQPRLVRFVLGKTINILGIVAAVAERLEFFTPEGLPRRSWLRMRFLRVSEPTPGPTAPESPHTPEELTSPEGEVPPDQVRVHEIAGWESDEDSLLEQIIEEIEERAGDIDASGKDTGESADDADSGTEEFDEHSFTGPSLGEEAHEVAAPGERLDEIAYRAYGDPAYWRLLAAYNDLANPMRLSPGEQLMIPPLSVLEESR
jgi:Contractile injection system tube protein